MQIAWFLWKVLCLVGAVGGLGTAFVMLYTKQPEYVLISGCTGTMFLIFFLVSLIPLKLDPYGR
jgi:hypothetical protein